MADNTTTYTTVIEAEVKGGDKLQDLGDKAQEANDKFVPLRKQIRQTTIDLQELADAGKQGTKEFRELSNKLDDLQDQQKRVAFQSGQIEDKLAALPGPIGQIGKSFASAKESVDTFGKGITAALGIVGLVVAAILAMKKALESTAEGQQTLNKLSQAFSSILGPLLAIVEKVAVPVFNKFAEILAKVGGAFAWFAEKLGISKEKIKEATLSVDKVQQDINEKEKKRLEDLAKKQEEARKKKEEADAKALEKRKKQLEEQKKAEEEANKVITDAYLTTLGDRDKEIYIRGQKLQEDLLKLEKAGIKDRTLVMESYKTDVNKINTKYDDEEKKKQEEKDNKAKEEAEKKKKEAEDAEKDRIDKLIQANEDEANLDEQTFNLKKAKNEATFQDELDLFDKTRELGKENLIAQKASADALTAYDKETAAVRIQIEKAQQETKLAIVSNALGTLAEAVGANTAAGKAIAVAQATIDTYAGATKALGAYPPPFGAIAAATVVVAGLLNVKKILSTEIPKMPGATGGGNSGASAPSIAPPTIPTTSAPQFSVGGAQNPSSQIAESLAQASGKPIKAYVVQQDVANQNAFARRTNNAATF
jgi:chromosome segregation ATPase